MKWSGIVLGFLVGFVVVYCNAGPVSINDNEVLLSKFGGTECFGCKDGGTSDADCSKCSDKQDSCHIVSGGDANETCKDDRSKDKDQCDLWDCDPKNIYPKNCQ